jgi:hypothetical protein
LTSLWKFTNRYHVYEEVKVKISFYKQLTNCAYNKLAEKPNEVYSNADKNAVNKQK